MRMSDLRRDQTFMGDEREERTVAPTDDVRPARRAASPIQRKLVVGASDDRYEREADRVAAAVMRTLSQGPLDDDGPGDRVQRSSTGRIQPKAHPGHIGASGGEVDGDTDAAIRRASGGGRPLDPQIRRAMERGFGADFSGVRVHADRNADDLNRRVQAKAFTTGRDIFFSSGQYSPTTSGGQELLAHELTHVVQQGGAAIARTTAPRPDDDTKTKVVESPDGKGGSKIVLKGPRGALGSVNVRAVDDTAVEATNLSVSPDQRGQGFGADLVAAAAKVGSQSGRSEIKLASQDDGSGKLDGWYQSLGFNRTGKKQRGYHAFAAKTSGLRQRKVQRTTIPVRRG